MLSCQLPPLRAEGSKKRQQRRKLTKNYFLLQGFGQRSRSPALPSNANFVDPKGRAVPAGPPGGPRVRLPVLQGPLTVTVQPDRIPFQAIRDQRQHSRDPRDPSRCQWGEGTP